MNRIVVTGTLGKDPTYKRFDSGLEIMEGWFCFQTRAKREGEWIDHHNWIDLTWFKPNEGVKPYLMKGRGLAIDGRLEIQTWKDKTTGANRSKATIIVEELHLIAMRDEQSTVPLVPKTEDVGEEHTPGTVPLANAPDVPF